MNSNGINEIQIDKCHTRAKNPTTLFLNEFVPIWHKIEMDLLDRPHHISTNMLIKHIPQNIPLSLRVAESYFVK